MNTIWDNEIMKSNQNESDEKIRLSMIKETASLYIGQLHLYYKAKRSGLNELIKLFTKFHSSYDLINAVV